VVTTGTIAAFVAPVSVVSCIAVVVAVGGVAAPLGVQVPSRGVTLTTTLVSRAPATVLPSLGLTTPIPFSAGGCRMCR
jgi:hypothetical protein